MIRTYAFAALTTSGIWFALIGNWNPVGSPSAWDPREAGSEMLNQGANLHVRRASFTDTSQAVTRWTRPGTVRSIAQVGDVRLRPTGVVVSLTAFASHTSTLDVCAAGQDGGGPLVVPVLSSVKVPTGTTMTCSTAGNAPPPYGFADTCSVTTATMVSKPQCSTNAGQSYCSTNVSNGAGPGNCSASGGADNGGVNFCSAASGTANATATCSTQAYNGLMNASMSYNCSAGTNGTTTQGRCSAGTQGSFAPTGSGGNMCSASTGNIGVNATQTNTCSVISDGGAGALSWNSCSTDGANGNNCSTKGTPGAGTTTDVCSVQKTFTNAECTVTNRGATGNGVCSSQPASVGNCSTINGTTVTPPIPPSKICGVTHP
jgi:hypothetical protein